MPENGNQARADHLNTTATPPGSVDEFAPPAPGPYECGPYPPTPRLMSMPGPRVTAQKKRWPTWAWVVAGLGGLGGLAVLALVASLLSGTVLTHQLLDEDFDTGSGVFSTGRSESGHIDYQVVDGNYTISALTSDAGGGRSLGGFVRTAYAVDASVEVVSVTGDESDTVVVVIGCSDSTGNEQYTLMADSGGHVALIDRVDNGIIRPESLAVADSLEVGAVSQLRIVCATSIASLSGMVTQVDLTAFINGVQVLTAHDDLGYDAFQAMVLGMGSDQVGVQVRFDNAKAIVPGA